MSASYPAETNYGYAGNSPITFVDFNGYFKISPYFAQKYPTLARIIEFYLPMLKDNPQAKSAWIKTVGFNNYAEGAKAFDMVTFGKGPWIDPTRPSKEIRLGGLARFAGADDLGDWDGHPIDNANNRAINYFEMNALEAALKAGNDRELGAQMFIVSSLIMHEASHWSKWKYNCCEGDDNYYEKGATWEENAF